MVGLGDPKGHFQPKRNYSKNDSKASYNPEYFFKVPLVPRFGLNQNSTFKPF